MAAPQGQGGGRRPPRPSALLRGLALRADVDDDTLSALLTRIEFPYVALQHSKPGGGRRLLLSPAPELLRLQRRVLDEVLSRFVLHPAAYAYRSGRSSVECAQVHSRAHTVIRLDVAAFFDKIRERHVYDALRRPTHDSVQLSTRQAYGLGVLCTAVPPWSVAWSNRGTGSRRTGQRETDPLRRRNFPYQNQREGHLPQGAPTSGAISNMVMLDVDEALTALADRLGLRYTRDADDLIFSSRHSALQRSVDELVRDVRAVLFGRLGLRLNDGKTRITRPGNRRLVLGLLVDGPAPRVPKEAHRALERHIRGVRLAGLESHAAHTDRGSAEDLRRHVEGLLSWVGFVEPHKGLRLSIDWARAQSVQGDEGLVADAGIRPIAVSFTVDDARASINALLRDGAAFRSSRDFVELIRFIGAQRRLAPFNAMVVRLQRPGARHVLTEGRWRQEYQRVPKPGAQRIMIFWPKGPYLVTYDVGDTEPLRGAPPLPRGVTDPIEVTTSLPDVELERAWGVLSDNVVTGGVRLTHVDQAAGACGMTYPTATRDAIVKRPGPRGNGVDQRPLRFEVEVNRNLHVKDRLVTLVHELAHLACGHVGPHPDALWPHREPVSHAVREVEAEATSHMVLTRLDSTLVSDDYLLQHLDQDGQVPDGVRLNLMVSTAARLLEMLKARQP